MAMVLRRRRAKKGDGDGGRRRGVLGYSGRRESRWGSPVEKGQHRRRFVTEGGEDENMRCSDGGIPKLVEGKCSSGDRTCRDAVVRGRSSSVQSER